MAKTRRYQIRINGTHVGTRFDCTGREAIRSYITDNLGAMARVGLRHDGNTATLVLDGERFEFTASKV